MDVSQVLESTFSPGVYAEHLRVLGNQMSLSELINVV